MRLGEIPVPLRLVSILLLAVVEDFILHSLEKTWHEVIFLYPQYFLARHR